MKYQYEDEKTKELTQEFMPNIVNGIEKLLNSKLNFIWIDIGTSYYDIHIEFSDNKNNHMDLYFEIKDEDMIENFFSKGFKMSEILDTQSLKELINKIKNK